MNDAIYEWFDIDDSKLCNQAERDFLAALVAHAPEWISFGLDSLDGMFNYDNVPFAECPLTVAWSVNDQKRNLNLRTLRVDFYGTKLVLGEDETGSLNDGFRDRITETVDYSNPGGTPQHFAEVAAKWLNSELARVIERREWANPSFHHSRYVLADTNCCISWSGSGNKKRSDSELGEPSQIVVVHPLSERQKNLDVLSKLPKTPHRSTTFMSD